MKSDLGESAMPDDIFISYSRRDQEFVSRLASDLDAQVAGVWFDQSDIQLGEKWHDEIMKGIRECKAFILVLSPDAVESKYVREELQKALELGKPIFPVIYRPAVWKDEFETLVKEVQTLDLRSGSYTDSFQKLVDGLVAAGAGQTNSGKPFLRQPAKIGMDVVLSKVPGWAFAWSLGWLAFWLIGFMLLFSIVVAQGMAGWEDLLNLLVILFSGGIGGFAGGLAAGLFTMLALRPNAPSISWNHMAPTIRIWAFSGPLGMIVSGVITSLILLTGAFAVQGTALECTGLSINECVGQNFGAAVGNAIGLAIVIALLFLASVTVAWFLTGFFAGRLAVRHIRRLEPGITNRQSWNVSLGWGCGALVAASVMVVVLVIVAGALGL
jgi:hypothetical protein